MKKQVFSFLLTVLLLLTLGATAFAAGQDGVEKGDIVYFGAWDGAPLRWILLDPEATNAGDDGAFLLSEQALTNQGVIYSWARAIWQGSEGQAWCTQFLKDSFSPVEQAAIPAVSKSEEAFQQYGLSWGAVSLEDEQVFFISTQELVDYIGPNDGDPGLSATYIKTGKPTYYWLRTPHGAHADYAGLVIEDNQVHDFLVYGSWGARPATNLSGEALLYLSPSERTLAPCDLGALPTADNGEWKATVVDPSLGLGVEKTSFSDGKLTLRYANAPQYAWLSLLVRDAQGKNVSYACLSKTETPEGELSFVPEVPEGCTLYLFAEMDNGAKTTNTASALCPLSWTVETPAPTPSPEPEAPAEEGGVITPAEPETVAPSAVTKQGALISFLRETWMFAIPFATLSVVAVILAIAKAFARHRRWDDEDDYEAYDEYEEDEDDWEE